MATIHVEYCGMSGSGKTVTAAKQDAARRAERFISEARKPKIIASASGAWAAMIWRGPEGWHRALIVTPETGLQTASPSVSGCADTLAECESDCRRWLADLATDWRNCFSADDVDAVCTDARQRAEIAKGCETTRRYHAAITAGLNENEAHHYACGGWHLIGKPLPESLAA